MPLPRSGWSRFRETPDVPRERRDERTRRGQRLPQLGPKEESRTSLWGRGRTGVTTLGCGPTSSRLGVPGAVGRGTEGHWNSFRFRQRSRGRRTTLLPLYRRRRTRFFTMVFSGPLRTCCHRRTPRAAPHRKERTVRGRTCYRRGHAGNSRVPVSLYDPTCR